MNNKKQFGFLIILYAAAFATLAFVLWPTINTGNEQANARKVVQDFYQGYLSYEGNPLMDSAYRTSPYLSPEMVAFLDEFTQGEMVYDPVLCAQEKPGKVDVSQPQISDSWASVTVSTEFEGHEFTVDLVKVDGDWLLYKVTCQP
mgnify:CR=1 FL=1